MSAIREATAPPAAETVIIDRLHTSDTLVVLTEPEPPQLTGEARLRAIAEHLYPSREVFEAENAGLLEAYRTMPQLPAPQDEDERDQAA